jgi:hypothetical protein
VKCFGVKDIMRASGAQLSVYYDRLLSAKRTHFGTYLVARQSISLIFSLLSDLEIVCGVKMIIFVSSLNESVMNFS